MAFQVTDDTLDYDANQEDLGKPVGDDFREGKLTAPILFALDDATEDEKEFWKRTMVDHDIKDGDLEHAKSLIAKYDGLNQSKKLANIYVERAKDSIDAIMTNSSATGLNEDIAKMLKALPDYILKRTL
jgi:octaprenyl-diphosphate synthase